MRVGIEVGGTFTDLVGVDKGRAEVRKVPSTPNSPDIGVMAAIGAAGIASADIADLVHGSTVATNAILERKGARVAFVTTAGFRDILFLQRHHRRNVYDLRYVKPIPPVARRDCYEVAERIDASGRVITALDEGWVRRVLAVTLRDAGYGAIAICLLSAYVEPIHELRLKRILEEEIPGIRISCSHLIAREFREFERASTVVLSAYVQPVIDSYLDRLESELKRQSFQGRLSIMQSNGGRLPAVAMRDNSITALFSGPAAGVMGAIRLAARSGRRDLITFDMGGTSTDVSLVADGNPSLSSATEIDGLPVRTPVLDIVSVGAGGGSLVWIDEGGMLRVGPQSAGAEPGPACYGRGGTAPTITDAHLIRGTVRSEGFLGGAMALDRKRAERAFAPIADKLGMDVADAATAAIRLAVANIVRAIQLVSTERGRDPRGYVLLPYGGAGPMLAAEVAAELGIREILVPANPGVVSALGLISTDFVKAARVTRRAVLDESLPDSVRKEFRKFQEAATAEFGSLGLDAPFEFSLAADMRFVGQAFEVTIDLAPEELPTLTAGAMGESFIEAHRRIFHHGGGVGRRIELVGFLFGIRRRLDAVPVLHERGIDLVQPPTTSVRSAGRTLSASLRMASFLKPGDTISGPSLIESYSATIWVPPGWHGMRDEHGNLILKRAES